VPDLNPLSQLEVESEIRRLSDRLTELTTAQADHAQEAAQADVTLKLKQARAWLDLRGHGGLKDEKEAQVLEQTALFYQAAKLADAVLKADHEAGRNLRAQLDALRTLAANIRDQVHYATGRGG
jgi:chromosome segregation ATPase